MISHPKGRPFEGAVAGLLGWRKVVVLVLWSTKYSRPLAATSRSQLGGRGAVALTAEADRERLVFVMFTGGRLYTGRMNPFYMQRLACIARHKASRLAHIYLESWGLHSHIPHHAKPMPLQPYILHVRDIACHCPALILCMATLTRTT
jgi:hypothetical protein